jgi:hypothetical protein
VVEAVVYAEDVAKPTVPACPLPIADPTLGEARHLPTGKCLPRVVAEADRQKREHDSSFSESMARSNMNGAPHLRALARVESATRA